MGKFEIIENTDKARENFEKYFYGSQRYYLTADDLKALSEGKCLATDINSEYVIFIELLEEGK